ncbi:MAG: hypothetical protein IKO19_13100 [Candidatus Riflebacteria bacterium]|nr:hypothetical protein [Candidatus Riflebacteria bacterium]
MDITVPSAFNTIRSDKIEIEDGKIYNRCRNSLLTFSHVVLALLLAFTLVIMADPDWQSGKKYNYKNNNAGSWSAIFFIVQLIIYDRFIRLHSVVDFSNACVYKEFFFFGLRFWISYYPKDQIIQVGNNIYGRLTNPGGKHGTINGRSVFLNPETNLFDEYQASILMSNGKTIDFEFGYFDEDYQRSLRFVRLLSDYWNIPSVRCNKNYHLVVCESKNNSYALVEEKMPYCSHLKKLIFFSIALVVLYSIVYYTMVFLDKYGL